MFDYITIIFIAVLVLGALIGFIRGGASFIWKLIVLGLAVFLAIIICKPFANWIRTWPMAESMHQGLFDFLAGKIDFTVAGVYHVTGNTMTSEAQIAAWNTAGKAFDPNFDVFHTAYASIGIPSWFFASLDSLLNNAIAAYDGASFALANPFADIITNAACTAMAFAIIFFGILLIGGIIGLVFHIGKRAPDKKISIADRLLGILAGLIVSAGIIWSSALVLNLLLVMDNNVSVYLKGVLHIDEPETWTFAKWIVTSNFGYQGLIDWFLNVKSAVTP